jgi:amidophosphoribosyltransferase
VYRSEIKDECGVFGVYGSAHASEIVYLGLFALQHRGEESAGIATSYENTLRVHKAMGLVGDVFNEQNLALLKGSSAIGHVRYSTTGDSVIKNAQPFLVNYSRGQVAIAHNGNLVNAIELRKELERLGSIFQSTMDSEIFVHLMAKPSYASHIEGIIAAVQRVKGAYSLIVLTEDSLIGLRDPHGFRPLSIGKIGSSYILSSETCAFDLVGAEFVRDVAPGEIVEISSAGLKSHFPFKDAHVSESCCIFEHIYFSRPDSIVFGENVGSVRERLGMKLAMESPADADLVIAVPDSGNFAALGYSKASSIPFGFGFTRNHYIGRTFISPTVDKRDFKVKIKLNPVTDFIKNKRLVVIDDSIVRGNTSKSRVKVLRRAGAKEVHLRISCPPHRWPCFYGIDFPEKGELIANTMSLEQIRDYLEVDSLGYLSHEGMLQCFRNKRNKYCAACFSGEYPVDFGKAFNKSSLEL